MGKNKSPFALLLATEVEDVINSLLNINSLKSVEETIKELLLEVSYNVDGSFAAHKILSNLGDKQKYLVASCPVPVLVTWSRIGIIQDDSEIDKFHSEHELNDEEIDWHRSSFKVESLLQIMYYHVTHGRHKKQRNIMNAHTWYEKCKSRELSTAFKKQCLCISYKSIKFQWSNLAKFTFLHSLLGLVPLLGHFDTQSCSILALDNPNNVEIISISGRKPEHNAVFQIKLSTLKSKPKMSLADLSTIKNLLRSCTQTL